MQLPSLERLSLRPRPACPTDANGSESASDEAEERLINYNRLRILPIPPSTSGAYNAVQTLFKNTDPKGLNLRKVRAKMTEYNQLKVVGLFQLLYNRDHPVYKAYGELRDKMQVTTKCNEYNLFYERVRTDELEGMGDESGMGPLRPWLNEKYLLHGTPVSSLDAVLRSAIDPTRTTASVYSPENNVFYQAEDVGKADQYTSPEGNLYRRLNEELGIDTSREMIPRTHYMLISRTLLGCANHIAQETHQTPVPYYTDLKTMGAYQPDGKFRQGYDSLIVEHGSRARGGDYTPGNFREFLVQKSAQVLPVMLVAYVRVMALPTPKYDRTVLDITRGMREHPWWLEIPKLLNTAKNDKAARRREEAFDGLTKAVPLFCEMMKNAMEVDGPNGDVFKWAVPVLLLLMRTCYEQPWENDVMVAMLQITQHEIDNYTMYGASTEVLRWLSGEKEVKALVSDMKEDVNRQDGLGSMELLYRLMKPVEYNYPALRYAVEAGIVPTLIDMAKDGYKTAIASPDEFDHTDTPEGDEELHQRTKLYMSIAALGILTTWAQVQAARKAAGSALAAGGQSGSIEEQFRDERGGDLPGGMIRILLNTLVLVIDSAKPKEKMFEKVLTVLKFVMPYSGTSHVNWREALPAVDMAIHYNGLAILKNVLLTQVRENLPIKLTCSVLTNVLSGFREGSWGTRNPEAERFLKLDLVKDIFETAHVQTAYSQEDFKDLIWELQFTLEIYLTTGTEAEKLLALTILSTGPEVKWLYKGEELIGHLVDLVLEDETDAIVGQAIDLLPMNHVFEVLLHYESYRNGTWTAMAKDTEKLVWYVTAYAKHMVKEAKSVREALNYPNPNQGSVRDAWNQVNIQTSTAWQEGHYAKKTASAHGVPLQKMASFGQFLLYEQSVGNLFEADARAYWLATRDLHYEWAAVTHFKDDRDDKRHLTAKIKYPTERYMDAIKPQWEAWKARDPSKNVTPLALYARIEWTDMDDEQRKPYIDAYQNAIETYNLFGSDSETEKDERSPPRKVAKNEKPPPVRKNRRVVISDDDSDGDLYH